MKTAIVDVGNWQRSLEKVKKIVKTSAIPALEGALFSSDGEKGVLTVCRDCSLWLSVAFPVKGDEMEIVLCDIEKVRKASAFFTDDITFAYDEKKREIQIRDQSRQCLVMVEPVSSFPEIPQWQSPPTQQEVPAKELANMYTEIKYAVCRQKDSDDIKKNVYYDGVRMAAIDGYQMAQAKCINGKFGQQLLLPPSALEWLKIFGDTQVKLEQSGALLAVSSESMTLYAKMPSGTIVPNYDSVIPKRYSQKCEICPDEFLKNLKFISSFEKNYKGKWVVIEGDQMYMDGRKEETCISIKGGKFEKVVVRFEYLYNAVKRYKGQKKVRFLHDSKNFRLVLSSGEEKLSLLCLIKKE